MTIGHRGNRVGLLGGSFDPPHEGHAHVTLEALKRFGLDEVCWLMSPGNPLKQNGPAPVERRIEAARQVLDHPSVTFTDYEVRMGFHYTAETLRNLLPRAGDTRYVWLMGADSMAGLHLWQDWTWIMENIPVGVLARPGQRISARMSKASARYRQYRLRGREARLLPDMEAPAWCYINIPLSEMSSTRIRRAGKWR